jgi:hypothetical protein
VSPASTQPPLSSEPPSQLSCPACAPYLQGTCGEDLVQCGSLKCCRRSCHACGRGCAPVHRSRACAGPAWPLLGHVMLGRALSWPRPGWADFRTVELGRRPVLAHWAGVYLKPIFYFQIQFNSSSNSRNSYLFEYLSKIHEINYVILLNSRSIQEKYKTQ